MAEAEWTLTDKKKQQKSKKLPQNRKIWYRHGGVHYTIAIIYLLQIDWFRGLSSYIISEKDIFYAKYMKLFN